MKNIAVLFGGKSSEYEVSLSSAYGVLSNIDRTAFNVAMIGITREGKWYLYEGDLEAIRRNTWCGGSLPEVRINMTTGTLCAVTDGAEREIPCDGVFAVLHGACGEDGTMQGLFAVSGIPVVGCGCTASAVCMDKALTKAIISMETDIPMAKMVVAHKGTTDSIDALREKCERALGGYPMFVKPACSGSSVGASKVRAAEDFASAVAVAFAEGEKIMIEECITGSEIELAVLEEKGQYTVSQPAEIDLGGSEFYDYDTKYVSDASSFFIPARLSAADSEKARTYALEIFKALECRGLSRVDFFHTPDGRIVFNEINTIPGFTPISMYPRLMIHSGISYSELITRLLNGALN
ncbi:MAG: D-alanine--D-alanine ligase [Ruminococcaceae bacterium]|nr:D-alanine--D-alanine ligase [Oscillospiraceae bacterium]